jgi:hypothetical protein
VLALAAVLGVFILSDNFAHESGLLAVVVMGMVLGNSNSKYLEELLYFKESLSVLLISILFILLAANINMDELLLIYNWKTAILFAVVVLLLRPVGVFLSTWRSSMKLNEKIFISWVGPRGIVAAGIASLFGLKLVNLGVPGAEYITPLVFMIVLVNVLLNATTARQFAKLIGVFLKKSTGILIVGASEVSQLIGEYLVKNDRHVVLIDSNLTNIANARERGLEAINTNIYSENLEDNIELNDVGFLMALTGSSDINKYAINKFKANFGENGSFRLVTKEEMKDPNNNPKEGLFSHTDDFLHLQAIAEKYPVINETTVNSKKHYEEIIDKTINDKDMIPLFLKDNEDKLSIISSFSKEIENIENGYKLVYLGKPLSAQSDNE